MLAVMVAETLPAADPDLTNALLDLAHAPSEISEDHCEVCHTDL